MIYFPLLLLALLLQVVVHELGHVLAARLFGDRRANFRLFPVENGRLAGLGLAITTRGFPFTQAQELSIDLAGVGLSWAAALAVGEGLRLWPHLGPVGMVFALAFYLMARLNLLLYAVRDALADRGRPRSEVWGDISVFAHRLHVWRGVPLRWGYGLCLGAGLLDALFIPAALRHVVQAWAGS